MKKAIVAAVMTGISLCGAAIEERFDWNLWETNVSAYVQAASFRSAISAPGDNFRWLEEFLGRPDVTIVDKERLDCVLWARKALLFSEALAPGISDNTNAWFIIADFVGRTRKFKANYRAMCRQQSRNAPINRLSSANSRLEEAERSALTALKQFCWWTGARNMTNAQKEACKTNIAERAMLTADEVDELFPNDFDPMRPLLWRPGRVGEKR